MPNCKEVARLLASDELADAVWSIRALVRFHIMMCRDCKGYAAQLRAIGAAARDRSDSDVLDRASFEKLQNSILERCLDASDLDTEDESDRDPEPPATQADPH